MTVDTYTGEIVPVDKSNAAAVIGYLENARSFLATAVDVTGPQQIAFAKAQIATAAEATKQLNLSKEIQLDAQEMVRRAEYALGKSIRKGQEDGSIRSYGQSTGPQRDYDRNGATVHVGDRVPDTNVISPSGFFASGSDTNMTYAVSDGVSDEQFDAALDEAKAEGNLSRANVVRKVKGQKSGETRQQRADKIRDLAERGYSSRQMPEMVGIGREAIKNIARDFDIEIPADKVIGKTRRHDSTRIVGNVVDELASLHLSLDLVDYDDLDSDQAEDWATSLDDSFKVLNRFRKQINRTAGR